MNRHDLLVVASFVWIATALPAQVGDGEARRFPPRGFKKIAMDEKKKKRLDHELTTGRDPKTDVFSLTFERPPGYDETVITDLKNVVLARGKGTEFAIPNLDVGFRYRIYIIRPKRSYLLFRETFVRFGRRDFPGKGWKPARDAVLALKRPKQFTPRTMSEAFDHPHHVAFKPGKTKHDVLYLMTRVADDKATKSERVASQSVDGVLHFWPHAKKGEKFRVHELRPHDRTYRTSKVMTVEKDYPLGK